MSWSPVQPRPEVARATGVMLYGGILTTHVLGLHRGFRLEGYVGVFMLFSCLLVWAGAVWLLVEDEDRTWWYALVNAALVFVICLLTLALGLPVIDEPLAGQWTDHRSMLLLFFSANLAALSGWILRVRRLRERAPVSSAGERARRRR